VDPHRGRWGGRRRLRGARRRAGDELDPIRDGDADSSSSPASGSPPAPMRCRRARTWRDRSVPASPGCPGAPAPGGGRRRPAARAACPAAAAWTTPARWPRPGRACPAARQGRPGILAAARGTRSPPVAGRRRPGRATSRTPSWPAARPASGPTSSSSATCCRPRPTRTPTSSCPPAPRRSGSGRSPPGRGVASRSRRPSRPGLVQQDWDILRQLARQMGTDLGWETANDVRREAAPLMEPTSSAPPTADPTAWSADQPVRRPDQLARAVLDCCCVPAGRCSTGPRSCSDGPADRASG
jgi:hypothetical protein